MITESTIDNLDEYDFGIQYGSDFAGMKIMRLDDFLWFCAGIGLIPTLEIKEILDIEHVEKICRLIAKYAMINVAWVSTHNIHVMTAFHNILPELNKAWIIKEMTTKQIDTAASFQSEHNKVRMDLFDSGIISEEQYFYMAKRNVALRCTIFKESDIPLWVRAGAKYVEVCNIDQPDKWLKKYTIKTGGIEMKGKTIISTVLGTLVGAASGTAAGYYVADKNKNEKVAEKQKRVDKFVGYFNILDAWMSLKEQNISLSEYFSECGYEKIAIYGWGKMGKHLYEELKDTGIEVAYAIDKNVSGSGEMKVHNLNDNLPEVDAVVVSATFDFDAIYEQLSDKVYCPIIFLEEVVTNV